MTWQQVLTRYVTEGRQRVAAAHAVGSCEFDGCMDGYRILEWAVARDCYADVAHTILRRDKAAEGMRLEGRGYAEVRRQAYATLQLRSGWELVRCCVPCPGEQPVCERARRRYLELVEAIEREGKER